MDAETSRCIKIKFCVFLGEHKSIMEWFCSISKLWLVSKKLGRLQQSVYKKIGKVFGFSNKLISYNKTLELEIPKCSQRIDNLVTKMTHDLIS